MAFLGRAKVPQPPQVDAAIEQLTALIARHDQALKLLDDLVRYVRPGALVPGRHVEEPVRDMPNKLHPPPPEEGG